MLQAGSFCDTCHWVGLAEYIICGTEPWGPEDTHTSCNWNFAGQADSPNTSSLPCRVRSAAIRCVPFPDQDRVSHSDQPWAVRRGSHCTPPSSREHSELTGCSGFSAAGPVISCSRSRRRSSLDSLCLETQLGRLMTGNLRAPRVRGLLSGTSQESQVALAGCVRSPALRCTSFPGAYGSKVNADLRWASSAFAPHPPASGEFLVRLEPPLSGRSPLLQPRRGSPCIQSPKCF